MASGYRSHSATTYASRTNTTIPAPSGIQDGDFLLLSFLIGVSGTPPTPALPTGFIVLQGPSSVADGGGFTVTRRLAYKVASEELGDYVVTHTSASSQGLMICVSGGDVGEVPVSSNNSGTGTTTTATGITTPTDEAYVGFIVHNWVLYGGASPPTGTTPTFTERSDLSTSLMYYADGVLATAGATGNKTHGNLNPGEFPWAAFLVSVAAAGGGGSSILRQMMNYHGG